MSRTQNCVCCGEPADLKDVCRLCYNGLYYWRRKSPSHMIRRHQRLQVYQKRLELVMGNVRVIKHRSAA